MLAELPTIEAILERAVPIDPRGGAHFYRRVDGPDTCALAEEGLLVLLTFEQQIAQLEQG